MKVVGSLNIWDVTSPDESGRYEEKWTVLASNMRKIFEMHFFKLTKRRSNILK